MFSQWIDHASINHEQTLSHVDHHHAPLKATTQQLAGLHRLHTLYRDAKLALAPGVRHPRRQGSPREPPRPPLDHHLEHVPVPARCLDALAPGLQGRGCCVVLPLAQAALEHRAPGSCHAGVLLPCLLLCAICSNSNIRPHTCQARSSILRVQRAFSLDAATCRRRCSATHAIHACRAVDAISRCRHAATAAACATAACTWQHDTVIEQHHGSHAQSAGHVEPPPTPSSHQSSAPRSLRCAAARAFARRPGAAASPCSGASTLCGTCRHGPIIPSSVLLPAMT